MGKKIKVLIVDDSPVKRGVLSSILKKDDEIEVIGYTENAEETLLFIKKNKPDLITMDINIPGGINGFELTKVILDKKPVPIIVISAIRNEKNKDEIKRAILKSGALYFMDSPPGPWNENFEKVSKEIIKQVKLLSKIDMADSSTIAIPDPLPEYKKIRTKLILIGISTGGPAILKEILSGLPHTFKTPVIVAQHISPGFDKLLVKQLNNFLKVPAVVVDNHEKILPGKIYFVPAGKITEVMNDEFVVLDPPKDYMGHLPSISALFASVISYYGKNVVAAIMTGMGKDGVEQLKMLKDNGAITIAQDKESSTIYSMPGEAVKANAATHVMTPAEITEFFIRFDNKYIQGY